MREDLLCEIRGRIVGRDGAPHPGVEVEFLPSQPWFIKDGVTLCPLGSRQLTETDGTFVALLTRSDLTGVQYFTRGALGNYRIVLNGPGPHNTASLLAAGVTSLPLTGHDA